MCVDGRACLCVKACMQALVDVRAPACVCLRECACVCVCVCACA